MVHVQQDGRCNQVLRQILKRYKLWGNLQGDVKFERESDHIGKAMTEEQETGLMTASESNPLLRTVVIIALNTALRKNEIRTLRWLQIDLILRTLTVGRTKTEGGSGEDHPAEYRSVLGSGALGGAVS